MQVECRGNMFTMPRRRRFKPRKDCVAILGKLSSLYRSPPLIYTIPPNLPLIREALLLPDGQPCRWQEWSMVSRDIIDISEFREFREISAISEYVIGKALL